jgi:hypothetical protein
MSIYLVIQLKALCGFCVVLGTEQFVKLLGSEAVLGFNLWSSIHHDWSVTVITLSSSAK